MRLRTLLAAVPVTLATATFAFAFAPATAPREASAAADAGAADAGPPVPACVAVTTTARLVPYGYDHVVTLTNGCSRDASCLVSTDVNPTPVAADVAKGTSVDVVTFMSSPASTFTARVRCTLK